jgi:hypothetical protein
MMHITRLAWLGLVFAACADPPKPEGCAYVCAADDHDCTSFPRESLPQRCYPVCYWGGCCELVDGVWEMYHFDCARPVLDGGIDSSDGAGVTTR